MMTVSAGTHFNFKISKDLPNAEVWRLIDHTVARWVVSHGGTMLLAEIAGWASYAEGQGDSSLPLIGEGEGRHGMRLLQPDELMKLGKESLVTAHDGLLQSEIATPFVLSGGHFYLRRNFMHESAVAEHIRSRRQQSTEPVSPLHADDLNLLFNHQDGPEVRQQRLAVSRAPGRKLFVLTGGPGTGKTSTVLRMLLALGREHQTKHHKSPVIRLCAPTGKAAQRLNDSLRQGAESLLSSGQSLPELWNEQLRHALHAESSTLHRLLGKTSNIGAPAWEKRQVSADIVVVDEASMVDLAMLRELLDALPDDAVLILVGDAEQLSSVGTGTVFLDIVTAMESSPHDDLVRLSHSFRADRLLIPIIENIRQGRLPKFEQDNDCAESPVKKYNVQDRNRLNRHLAAWCCDLYNTLESAGAFIPLSDVDQTSSVLHILDALKRQQLLCALKEYEFGSIQVNRFIEEYFRQRLDGFGNQTWYPGRAVMINRNDYTHDLFNGDVGICLSDGSGGLQVWFESSANMTGSTAHASEQKTLRSFPVGHLPSHQCAFATTVHKSQGSEYDRVAILLPPDKGNAVLSRQLLYTAFTRAKSKVEIWGCDEVLEQTLRNSVVRSSTLQLRINA